MELGYRAKKIKFIFFKIAQKWVQKWREIGKMGENVPHEIKEWDYYSG